MPMGLKTCVSRAPAAAARWQCRLDVSSWWLTCRGCGDVAVVVVVIVVVVMVVVVVIMVVVVVVWWMWCGSGIWPKRRF
jgi:hypothetical protein